MKTYNFNCTVQVDLQGTVGADNLEEAIALALLRWNKQIGVQGILDGWANKTETLPFRVVGWDTYPTVVAVKDGRGNEEIVKGDSLFDLEEGKEAVDES